MKENRPRQAGNILIFVLIGIALFAALMFAMTRSTRAPGKMTSQDARIQAETILTYAEKINGAVQIVMGQNGCLASEVSFQNTVVAGYTNTNSPPTRCLIFDMAGAGMIFDTPPATAMAVAGNYLFTGNVCVDNVGTGPFATCASDGLPNEELLMILPSVNVDVCDAINQILGNTAPMLVDTDGSFNSTKFTGTFADGTAIGRAGYTTYPIGCHQSTGGLPGSGYHFYYTLLAR